jgi:nicotinamidase-related amidase
MPDSPAVVAAETAMLVMDYQNGLLRQLADADADAAVARVAAAADLVRGAGGQVVFVRVAFDEDELEAIPAGSAMSSIVPPERREMMHKDAPTTALHEGLSPRPEDIVLRKTRVGAFSTTDLDERLKERGITSLVLAGMSTSGVVLSTLRDAADRDYRVIVLADGCVDPRPEIHTVLVEQVFPWQAQVTTIADLERSLEQTEGVRG